MELLRQRAILPLIFAWAVGTSADAAGILQQIPRDALGALVVRNLSESDAKVGKLLGAVGSRLPGPLALLKSIAGLDAGIDSRRDLLVVLLPPQSDSRQFHLAVWLPVHDYEALVRSLDGDPGRRIAAVTLAGEDLLVTQQNDWAVVMDVDQRERLETLNDGKNSTPPQIAQWFEWIGTNDAAIVVLPGGMRAAWAWAAQEGLFQVAPPLAAPAPHDDDLFGPANQPSPSLGWPAIRQSIRQMLAMAPELTRWAASAQGFACGLLLDSDANALVSLRVALAPQTLAAEGAEPSSLSRSSAPRLYDGGAFVTIGDGGVSPHWTKLFIAPYVRQQTYGLTTQFDGLVAPGDLSNLCASAETLAADLSGFSLLTRPGTDGDGIYTHNFLALRVASSEQFTERVAGLVDQWNAMIAKVESLKPLAFDSRDITVADHRGREFAIDMVAAGGGPPLPDIKAAIEKLFGPGGKFRIQIVTIDDSTVLVAVATEAQLAEILDIVDGDAAAAPTSTELQTTSALFATKGQWQLFVSPRGYVDWLRRQRDAILGDVIGAPIVPEYPESPPIGIAGGVVTDRTDARVLWTEVALPVETMRGFAKFSRK